MNIVGIAACPAGLAHTPMAASALTKAGKKLGYNIKIEQQGVMGQVDKITAEEATAADLVIIASDQKLEGMDRFEGKKVYRVNINTCISSPEKTIEKLVSVAQGGN
ncbi:PTS system IIB component, Fru family [Amphibacillus marinus]|uniref:PTS system IIB component, Fru family n=1 Tax=Amphibacillus marinus TaxID=872970 RepID=A0A1H8L9M2_9BACI|nr:fructose PTS transporter subunit IIB [Amphibacillus marinus]SEO01835.1 PTS system IIB component, Fru family [Amphibacillus marinus]